MLRWADVKDKYIWRPATEKAFSFTEQEFHGRKVMFSPYIEVVLEDGTISSLYVRDFGFQTPLLAFWICCLLPTHPDINRDCTYSSLASTSQLFFCFGHSSMWRGAVTTNTEWTRASWERRTLFVFDIGGGEKPTEQDLNEHICQCWLASSKNKGLMVVSVSGENLTAFAADRELNFHTSQSCTMPIHYNHTKDSYNTEETQTSISYK